MPYQDNWRYCQGCHVMFFAGYGGGRCAGGGGHRKQGFNFVLPYGMPSAANAQGDWRYCENCHAMFFNGYDYKGRCPGGAAHSAQGICVFTLPHSRRSGPKAQDNWRYCKNCHAMFFAGHGGGSCAAGGGHVADWLNFTLPHTGGEGWTTVQGWIGPTGDGAFNQKVLSHIETLKKSPSFQKMWGVILKTGHRVTILPAEPGGSNYTTDQFQNDSFLLDDGITPGRGCDVIVRYNPDSEGMALQKGNQPWRRAGAPYISLGHELVHCWMSTTGVAPRSIGQRESRATGLPPFADVEFSENRFRRELGLPLRDVY